MRLSVRDLEERARWLLTMRWIACVIVLLVVWILSITSSLLAAPHSLYAVWIMVVTHNLFFEVIYRKRSRVPHALLSAKLLIVLQLSLDLVSLTFLLYFAGLPLNPFILYYVFPIIIAGILFPGLLPYFLAFLASFLVGLILLLQEYNLIPRYALAFPWLVTRDGRGSAMGYSLYMLGTLIAVASTLGMTAPDLVSVYAACSFRKWGGQIEVESAPNKGSVFRILLAKAHGGNLG
jgi:hypothetical protein